MARTPARPLLALAACLLAAACSLLLNFSEDGLPCDYWRCNPGYACGADDRCHRVNVGPCECPAGNRCAPGAPNVCLPDTCDDETDGRRCPPGYRCLADGGSLCVVISQRGVGFPCESESDCDPGQLCMLGAIATPRGDDLRPGFCAERCNADRSCSRPELTCRDFPLALDAGSMAMCVHDGTRPCASSRDCFEEGLVCTAFGHIALGVATLCDLPKAGGADAGTECIQRSRTDGGGTLCANGLCAPRPPPDNVYRPRCAELCNHLSCTQGTCALVPFQLGAPTWMLPMCVPSSTLCTNCTPSSCGIDAPICGNVNSEARCIPPCSRLDGGYASCPGGYSCQVVSDAGATRCIPAGGSCP